MIMVTSRDVFLAPFFVSLKSEPAILEGLVCTTNTAQQSNFGQLDMKKKMFLFYF